MTNDRWQICPACCGNGHCVNPNIDAHGLTAEDFAEDPDFAEDYFSGAYDQPCAACKGSGKVRESHLKRLDEAAEDRRLAARENGDFDAYCTAYDYRYGY